MSRDKLRWVTDLVPTPDTDAPIKDYVLTSHSHRPLQHKTFLGRSSRFLEKLQNDRDRDMLLHCRSLDKIPHQLKTPTSSYLFYLAEPTNTPREIYSKATNTVMRNSVYLRHGYVPPIYATKSNQKLQKLDIYKVEPLSIDRKLIVNSVRTVKSLDTKSHSDKLGTYRKEPLSDITVPASKKPKNFKAVKSRGLILHDRPLHKTLERINFVNPFPASKRRPPEEYECSSDFEALSAINSVRESNHPGLKSVSPEQVLTVRDVLNARPPYPSSEFIDKLESK